MILAAVGMLKEARLIQGRGVRAVAGGARADLLEQRLKAQLDGAEAIISIGLGGALDPALVVGDIVIGSEVLRPRSRWVTDPAWTLRLVLALPGAKRGAVYGSDDMVLHALDKAKLRSKGGAMLADMESHVAARIAAAKKLPFVVVRVVSDTAGLSLPTAVRAGIKPDGGMNLPGVLAALAKSPGQLSALMRVGRDADQAFKVLKTVRSALGPELGWATSAP
jgi:adenosylhomocysteine nucleosidase